jgi:hypothetical protein
LWGASSYPSASVMIMMYLLLLLWCQLKVSPNRHSTVMWAAFKLCPFFYFNLRESCKCTFVFFWVSKEMSSFLCFMWLTECIKWKWWGWKGGIVSNKKDKPVDLVRKQGDKSK